MKSTPHQMNRLFCILLGVGFVSACAPLPFLAPPPASTATPFAVPTVSAEDLLTQQVRDNLTASPRPTCEAGKIPGKEWDVYRAGLTASLRTLFSDPRAQSLAVQPLIGIFKRGSGLDLMAFENNAGALLISIVNSNCPLRIGGGASPDAPRDVVVVLDRRGDLWQIAQVAEVLNAVWANDHWIVLVKQTQWGGGADFEIWNARSINAEWKKESLLSFNQLHSVPLPRLSSDGLAITLYSLPLACKLPSNPTLTHPLVESDYQWQNGKYQCLASRVIAPTPAPTPTKR